MITSVVRQVVELEYKSSVELRKIYNNLFPDKCAENSGKDQLRPKISYRLQ